jgi:hypothetical protein
MIKCALYGNYSGHFPVPHPKHLSSNDLLAQLQLTVSYRVLRGLGMVLRSMLVDREIARRTGRPVPGRDAAF